jgi:hypothetical protein
MTTLGITLAAALLAGCASEKSQEAALAHMGDESPPDFLTGPASLALAGFDGFSANAVSTTSDNSLLFPAAASEGAGPRAASGQLIGRKGQIIFQPMSTANAKNGKIVRGGMFFIWDTSRQSGFVVSEALQGFAPISAPCQITDLTPVNQEPPPEAVNGHPCHRIEIIAALSNGSTAKLTEWRADDLNRFPVRLRSESGGRRTTVDFSDIRLDIPSAALFSPPADFTQYAGASALINELMIRESATKKGLSTASTPLEQAPDSHQPGFGGRMQ